MCGRVGNEMPRKREIRSRSPSAVEVDCLLGSTRKGLSEEMHTLERSDFGSATAPFGWSVQGRVYPVQHTPGRQIAGLSVSTLSSLHAAVHFSCGSRWCHRRGRGPLGISTWTVENADVSCCGTTVIWRLTNGLDILSMWVLCFCVRQLLRFNILTWPKMSKYLSRIVWTIHGRVLRRCVFNNCLYSNWQFGRTWWQQVCRRLHEIRRVSRWFREMHVKPTFHNLLDFGSLHQKPLIPNIVMNSYWLRGDSHRSWNPWPTLWCLHSWHLHRDGWSIEKVTCSDECRQFSTSVFSFVQISKCCLEIRWFCQKDFIFGVQVSLQLPTHQPSNPNLDKHSDRFEPFRFVCGLFSGCLLRPSRSGTFLCVYCASSGYFDLFGTATMLMAHITRAMEKKTKTRSDTCTISHIHVIQTVSNVWLVQRLIFELLKIFENALWMWFTIMWLSSSDTKEAALAQSNLSTWSFTKTYDIKKPRMQGTKAV